MILREPFKNRTNVPRSKMGEGNAVTPAAAGRTGKRRRKEGNVSAEERGCQVKREGTPPQSLGILNLSSLSFSLAILDNYI